MPAFIPVSIAAFVVGAIPFAYLVSRQFGGIDITRKGSRNVGAVNTFKEVGVNAGIAVLVLDTAKGCAVMAAILIAGLSGDEAFLPALAVTLGHNFSFFLRGRGGKGVAVVFGLSLVLFPIMTLISLIALPISYLLTRSIVWSFVGVFVALNALTIATGQPAADVNICLTLTGVVTATHLWRNREEVLSAIREFDFVRLGKIE